MANILLALGFVVFFVSPSLSFAEETPEEADARPLALVWGGKGNCRMVCLDAAKSVAQSAGFRVRVVDEGDRNASIFSNARVWIQPGGYAGTQAKSMGPVLMRELREFVARGGGYVGFCAGSFLATTKVGSTEVDGLGIMPGQTRVLRGLGSPKMLKVTTASHGNRWMYFSGGSYVLASDEELAANEATLNAHYSNGAAAGYQGRFGQGKVSVTGFHPEATAFWKSLRGFRDSDGSDQFYAVEMIRWAAKQEARVPRPVPPNPQPRPQPEPEDQGGEDPGNEDGGEGDDPETEEPPKP